MVSELRVDTIHNEGGDNDTGLDMSTNDVVAVKIAGSEKARWDASGNLLMGKTAVDASEHGFEVRANGLVVLNQSGGYALQCRRFDSDGSIIEFRRDDAACGEIGISGGNNLYISGTATDHAGLTFATNSILPTTEGTANNDTVDLGQDGNRFDDVYATNGTISTSDENEKQNIASFTTKELAVATKLSALFKTFKWKNRVAEKADKARTHSGIIAQTVKTTFASEGLDAANYGLFTSSTWTDDDGKEQTLMGVRNPELFSFIFGSIEARLAALEAK